MDDLRALGAVEVRCELCRWCYWVEPLDPCLEPGVLCVCPACQEQDDLPKERDTLPGMIWWEERQGAT